MDGNSMRSEYEKLDDFLIYAICFILGAITYLIFPKDYTAPVGPPTAPTRTILEQTTVGKETCVLYGSSESKYAEPTPICYKQQ